MVMSELLQAVRSRGVPVSEHRVRFAMREGRIPTPRMDGAHRFCFTDEDVELATVYFRSKMKTEASALCK